MDDGRKHVAGMRLQVVIGKRRMKVGERLPVFSASEVALERDEFGAALKGHAMVHVVVVHVPVRAVSSASDAAGDGCGIKTDGVGKPLEAKRGFPRPGPIAQTGRHRSGSTPWSRLAWAGHEAAVHSLSSATSPLLLAPWP